MECEKESSAPEALLSGRDLEALLKLSGRTIARLVAGGALPRPIVLGGSRRWRARDIYALTAGTDTGQSLPPATAAPTKGSGRDVGI